MIFGVAVVFVSFLGTSLGVDLTLFPDADGKTVVDAVINRIRSNCIFGDDRLFLRRLAYVETSYGQDSKTYRKGYHGGIWQIDEDKFRLTKYCSYSRLRTACSLIKTKFAIDWTKVNWSDLRKPLYSGLAATLYIKYRTSSPPTSISAQASFWKAYIRTGGSTSVFFQKAKNLPGSACKTKMDLAFIIDGSGSVSLSDFKRMLAFIKTVIDGLTISDEEIRVAVLEYSSKVNSIIHFNRYSTKASLQTAVTKIKKPGGGTYTDVAIKGTVDQVFSSKNGARANAKKVAILITDGRSRSTNKTVTAADEAKKVGITMFAVGVGNAFLPEIQAAATQPYCTHVFILRGFSEIDSLLYSLKDSSCSAPQVIPKPGTTVTKPLPDTGTAKETYTVTDTDTDGTTSPSGDGKNQTIVKSEVKCGTLHIYASYKTSRPGPAFYDFKDSARDGKPSIIYLSVQSKGKPLYITVVASKLPSSAQVTSCVQAIYTVGVVKIPAKPRVVCLLRGVEQECTKEDFKASKYKDLLCEDANGVANPCTRGAVSYHAHPSDLTKYIRCDVTGKMYITQCPGRQTYNPATKTCGHQSVGGTGPSQPQDSNCIARNLANGDFYFPYKPDPHKYIQCDVWGRAWVKPCPAGLTWDDPNSTCNKKPDPANPCTSTNNGKLFPHPTEKQKFLICSNGRPIVQTCPWILVFRNGVCNWPLPG